MRGRLVFDLTGPDGQLAVAYERLNVEVLREPLGELVDEFIAECLVADGEDQPLLGLLAERLRELADRVEGAGAGRR